MTRLGDMLCEVRSIVEDNNQDRLKKRIQIFTQLYEEIKRNITRFTRDDKHELCFNSHDIIAIATDTKIILNNLHAQINVNKMVKETLNHPDEKVDDGFMEKFTTKYADIFYVAARLTEFHSVMCYLGTLLNLLEMQYEQGELDFVLMDTIKKYLGK